MVYRSTMRRAAAIASATALASFAIAAGRLSFRSKCTISRNGPARFRINGPTLHGLPAEPRFESSTRPFSLRQVF
jgi:hypothetical protein